MGLVPAQIIGRYELFGEIASGGMATVHFGRMRDPSGVSRVVAIKRLHPQNAKDPYFVTAFVDEARMAARVRHPNVVSMHETVTTEGELLLVMDYVPGETLARLAIAAHDAHESVPVDIAVAIIADVLRGLGAAHAARDAAGHPMELVHRDVSPQNVLVGQDGTSRIMDFGVAKALGRSQAASDERRIKGKAAYMSPEQIMGEVDARTDLWAVSVVAWELLTMRRLFKASSDVATLHEVIGAPIPSLQEARPDLPPALVAVIERGLARSVLDRWQNARDYEAALCAAVHPASTVDVAAWVQRLVGARLRERAAIAAEVERAGASSEPESPTPVALAAPAASPSIGSKRVAIVAFAVAAVALLALGAARFFGKSADAQRDPSPPAPSSVAASPAALEPLDAAIAPLATTSAPPPVVATATAAAHSPSRAPHPKGGAASTKPALCQFVDAEGIVKFRPCK